MDAVNPSRAPVEQPVTSSLPELAAGVVGGALIGAAPATGRGRIARAAGLALVGLAARRIVAELIRDIGDRRRQMVMRSSIEIERNVADVFAFLNDFENFPRVIGNLRTVVDYQDGRAHWEAFTPTGHIVQWDTVVTKYVPRSVIAWESTSGSEVRMKSLVRFTVVSPTRTRIDIETTYCPPHTGVYDAIRTLFGPAQEKRLQNDLTHARYYLESLAPHASEDGEQPKPPRVSEADRRAASDAERQGPPAIAAVKTWPPPDDASRS